MVAAPQIDTHDTSYTHQMHLQNIFKGVARKVPLLFSVWHSKTNTLEKYTFYYVLCYLKNAAMWEFGIWVGLDFYFLLKARLFLK